MRFAMNDIVITAIKYHTTERSSIGTDESASDTTNAIVTYDTNSLYSRSAAIRYIATPTTDVISHEASFDTFASIVSAKPMNGTIANPVPTKATAAERKRSDLTWSTRPAI